MTRTTLKYYPALLSGKKGAVLHFLHRGLLFAELMKPKDFIKGTVTYDNYGQYFWINHNGGQQMLGELRGWGAIQNLFKNDKGIIDIEKAGKFQDEIGEWICQAINEKIQRENV